MRRTSCDVAPSSSRQRPAVVREGGHHPRSNNSAMMRPARKSCARVRARRRGAVACGGGVAELQKRRLFTVDCGRYRQSGPRPDTRLLRQPALEGLTRSARTDSPRRIGRKVFRRSGGGGGGY
ncbi:hypothetical protein F511_46240 [Dorcoceras hygrometricum]|uniref:Uncharacterized protein n=1 Tax=Dorcoceras hygrometricum TaxID=472368 RepID=A0A2Z6ZU12_9LAMI|nr:hypothetical protein F511_46240 [Dorcoceras hygrometricum]